MEFAHLNAFCSKSSDSSKANPRGSWLDEGEDNHSWVECDLLSIGQADLATYRSFAQHFTHPRSLICLAKNSNCLCALLAFFNILFQFFFFQISDDVLIEADNLREGKATGYIHNVSPLKNNHFDFQLQTKNKTIRAACFGPKGTTWSILQVQKPSKN